MSGKRFGLGPHTMRDGAIVKLTEGDKPRERCFMDACHTRPKTIITWFRRRVWVCNRHKDLDGMGGGSTISD